MTRDEYITTYLEGARHAESESVMYDLVGKMYDSNKIQQELYETIEFMNDVVRDKDWTMTCRSCLHPYQPDCELSEMFGAENYCGGSDRCCP